MPAVPPPLIQVTPFSQVTPEAWLRPSLHPVYARLICAELLRRGFTQAEILQGTRLHWADLHVHRAPLEFLSFEQVRRLIVRALDLTACPWLGLTVGDGTQLSAHGSLGYAAMAAADVAQVLGLMQRFTTLRESVAYFDVELDDGLALVLREEIRCDDTHEYLMGHFAAGLLRLLETVTGQDLRSCARVQWPFAAPAWADAYLAHCPHSTFGAERLRIELPAELLRCPSLAPDPDAHRLALRDCERQLTEAQGGSVGARVRRRLLAASGTYPTLAEMAALEHIGERTLMRHLRDEGLSYQGLLDSVREELACWLLVHTELSVEAVAERLGYQDTSNFSRTFRRWLGVTPRAFRESAGAP